MSRIVSRGHPWCSTHRCLRTQWLRASLLLQHTNSRSADSESGLQPQRSETSWETAMNSNQISKAVRLALMAGAVSALAAPAAFAADATTTTTTSTTTDNQSTAQLGKIEVAGTRIKRPDVETAQPVTIITQKEIKATGLHDVGDILATMPQI